MDHNEHDSAKIFGGTATRDLAERIAVESGQKLGEVTVSRFSDGEFQPSFEETVRGKVVFIVQSTMPPSDNLFELLLMVDAAKRASAQRIVAVIPYFGFARQDRKDKPRVSIGAKLVANMLIAAGVDRVMTMDLHADQIQGFFEVPVDHLFASSIFLPHIQSLGLKDLIMAAPDTGGTKRANAYAKHLGVDMAICYKQRKVANKVDSMTVIGDVSNKNVVLIDDMVDTGLTFKRVRDHLRNQFPAITELRTGVLWWKGHSEVEPDYFVEKLPTNPWIHQPFEDYDSLRPHQLEAWIRKGKSS